MKSFKAGLGIAFETVLQIICHLPCSRMYMKKIWWAQPLQVPKLSRNTNFPVTLTCTLKTVAPFGEPFCPATFIIWLACISFLVTLHPPLSYQEHYAMLIIHMLFVTWKYQLHGTEARKYMQDDDYCCRTEGFCKGCNCSWSVEKMLT